MYTKELMDGISEYLDKIMDNMAKAQKDGI